MQHIRTPLSSYANDLFSLIIRIAVDERNIILQRSIEEFQHLLILKVSWHDEFYSAGIKFINKLQELLEIIINIDPNQLPNRREIVRKILIGIESNWREQLVSLSFDGLNIIY